MIICPDMEITGNPCNGYLNPYEQMDDHPQNGYTNQFLIAVEVRWGYIFPCISINIPLKFTYVMVVHPTLTPNALLQGAGPVLKIRPLAPLANLGMGMENPVAHGEFTMVN